jgi:ABC-type lipoprotein release transport system permease subunit
MLIVRQSAPVLIAGAALGIAGAAAIARIAASRFAGLAGFDLMSVAAVTALLVSVALTASHLPARRATRIDPLHALRQD